MLQAIISLALLVSSDPPTAQELVDRAASGSVVELGPENALDGVSPLRIWKPLVLTAKAPLPIYTSQPYAFVPLEAAISLEGPGSGTVVLHNLEIRGFCFPGIPDAAQGQAPAPRIFGGGFDALELYNCSVVSPRPLGQLNCPIGDQCGYSGRLLGADAVTVFVDHVLVVGCKISASTGWTWDECVFSQGIPGTCGINAPRASVQVFESSISGAGQELLCGLSCDLLPGDPALSGRGAQGPRAAPCLSGPGVRAVELNSARSSIRGGLAPLWYWGYPGPRYQEFCGYGWAGAPFEPTGLGAPTRSHR